MRKVHSKYTVIIPNNIKIFYSKEKKIIIFKGPLATRSLKLSVPLLISEQNQTLKISSINKAGISNKDKKKIKTIQGTTKALIKQLLIESSTMFYKKLKIIGVGYRIFDVDNLENKVLLLKLGYSHPIYFRSSEKLNTFCLKFTKLFIFANSYDSVTQTASLIRAKKKPEPYKGKGILYDTEKVILKEGKKN